MRMQRPTPERPGPGQESVWDYPRPPAVAPTDAHVVVWFAGQIVAETRAALRVMETSHPPSFYLPRADVDERVLVPSHHRTFCEFKGQAAYADLVVGEHRSPLACWWYPEPVAAYAQLRDTITFYPSRVERATVDGEDVRASEGDFYGGWITSAVTGPFKGGPGTMWW
jgi:uncharacterized protein (DUF427 family)